MTITGGARKIIERGGWLSMWKGNGTSVLHRFPYSAINFYCYENALDVLIGAQRRREGSDGDENEGNGNATPLIRFMAGAFAGSTACIACYPLDLIRTRLTTQLPGKEHYKGITDALQKIIQSDGPTGLYAGLGPTLLVAVPNFAISYTVYGTLKEYVLEDDLFYNVRKIDIGTGEERLGFSATLLCGAASGIMSTVITFPFDTVRRRMQIQSLHISRENWLTGREHFTKILRCEGKKGLYRGIQPEILKVIPMVATMFTCYEYLKRQLKVR
eukprot:CAMPEP_0195527684 /NCGR_PEP_ID=MMETSP0794_2-20130614/29556_1 /TAXON_ID=515487 /ORGANISM="Stephanopyxis turris, Strain CCMP 815" /LENGTH=271 /DNA_ID=CAMNT_0040658661 /DNA_START=38 /DNA_END=853 /DNA_ORIENTATION=+